MLTKDASEGQCIATGVVIFLRVFKLVEAMDPVSGSVAINHGLGES